MEKKKFSIALHHANSGTASLAWLAVFCFVEMAKAINPCKGDGKEGIILRFAPKKGRSSKLAKACFFLFYVIQ